MARIVLVHGFTQTRACWGGLVSQLIDHHDVVVLDAPGHGTSADLRTDLWETAEWIADEGGAATYIGYSMGARMCLHTALARPESVERLLLVSGTAGIDDDAERSARRDTDEGLARRVEEVGVETFVDEWLAQPMFSHLSPVAQWREARLTNSVAGLASSLRLCGTGSQDPLWDRLGEIASPALITAGASDEKFAAEARRMAEAIDGAELEIFDDSGHSVHLEQPGRFGLMVTEWLAGNR
jgi:2-succinyl-6-hydroxy-2,4-cyclohexadiene-1-carboxylate synthase